MKINDFSDPVAGSDVNLGSAVDTGFHKKTGSLYVEKHEQNDELVSRSTHDVAELRKFGNVTGLMYTTWQNKYDLLEPFARAFFALDLNAAVEMLRRLTHRTQSSQSDAKR